MPDLDGGFTPWADKPEDERHERILLDVASGRKMEESVAVITDSDRAFWRRMVEQNQSIRDRGGSVEIPFFGSFS